MCQLTDVEQPPPELLPERHILPIYRDFRCILLW